MRMLRWLQCRAYRGRLDAYCDGELSLREAAAVQAHVRLCPQCAAELRELREVILASRAMREEPVPRPRLSWEDLRGRLETPAVARPWAIRAAPAGAMAVLVAAAVLAALPRPPRHGVREATLPPDARRCGWVSQTSGPGGELRLGHGPSQGANTGAVATSSAPVPRNRAAVGCEASHEARTRVRMPAPHRRPERNRVARHGARTDSRHASDRVRVAIAVEATPAPDPAAVPAEAGDGSRAPAGPVAVARALSGGSGSAGAGPVLVECYVLAAPPAEAHPAEGDFVLREAEPASAPDGLAL